jgi:hypothetical protein
MLLGNPADQSCPAGSTFSCCTTAPYLGAAPVLQLHKYSTPVHLQRLHKVYIKRWFDRTSTEMCIWPQLRWELYVRTDVGSGTLAALSVCCMLLTFTAALSGRPIYADWV